MQPASEQLTFTPMSQVMFLGLKRFAKGFLAGGLAQVTLILSNGVDIRTFEDARAILVVLLSGFLVGGILAMEKMINYYPPEK